MSCQSDRLTVEVPFGEFFDKITILEIKADKLQREEQRLNVKKELVQLSATAMRRFSKEDLNVIRDTLNDLRETNLILWSAEEKIRNHEIIKDFGSSFIELARLIYTMNDHRFKLKRLINLKLGSALIEEKSHQSES